MDYDDPADEDWCEDDDDGEEELLLCPSCQEPVFEETQQCPHCGDWITAVYPSGGWKRTVWIIAAMMVIAALVLLLR